MAEPDPLFCDPKLQYQNMNNLLRSGELTIFDTCVKTIGMMNAFLRKIDGKTGIVTDEFDDSPFHLLAAGRYILVKLRPPELTSKTVATFVPAQTGDTLRPAIPQRSRPNWDLTGRYGSR